MNTTKYFSQNYQEARRKLLDAASALDLTVESFAHPLKGMNDEGLYTDVIWIGPKDAKTVLVTSSSTHGVEGFLGSAVQVGSLLAGKYDNLPKSTAVLLIHAINPWGFSWLRRTNEDGVDLFRNFVDFNMPVPKNDLYDTLVDTIVPKKLNAMSQLKLIFHMLKYGKSNVKAAIPKGQYTQAHGPFYGGAETTWSNKILRKIISTKLKNAEHVIALDYHTGLGDNGVGEIIGFDRPGEESYELAKRCWGDNYISAYSAETTAYEINGILKNAYSEELPDTRLLFGAHEFGTCDEMEVFKALQQDHWLYTYGNLDTPRASEIKNRMREAFYCDYNEWKDTVLSQAFKVENQALQFGFVT